MPGKTPQSPGLFDLDDPPTESAEPRKQPRVISNRIPCPWFAAPPHTLPERWAIAADLEEMLAVGGVTANWEEFSRYLTVACYVLSGVELERVARIIVGIVRGESRG